MGARCWCTSTALVIATAFFWTATGPPSVSRHGLTRQTRETHTNSPVCIISVLNIAAATVSHHSTSVWSIVGVVIAACTLLFGTGFVARWFGRRRRIRVQVEHRALYADGDQPTGYGVTVTTTSGGERDEHVQWIEVRTRDSPLAANQDGIGWNTISEQVPINQALPARGAPAITEIPIPAGWVEARASFVVLVKLSSRPRPYRSKEQAIDEGVVNVLRAT
jgi:hypothetical protein